MYYKSYSALYGKVQLNERKLSLYFPRGDGASERRRTLSPPEPSARAHRSGCARWRTRGGFFTKGGTSNGAPSSVLVVNVDVWRVAFENLREHEMRLVDKLKRPD
ncbi:hypothetical protein GWI33_008722 [Rhynchophorus ferrugineus]|uniref:Uncharacterized protein n=1 Tax=Rhynchophorus ferrugineus TaxID=354439 RepID=A0A834IFW8_RHYFE|nr:hypothetical protein GWI33_008722 [Rhynchophorus ferrugineus]